MKKIFLFSRDPGAANCIIPVYRKLRTENSIEADLYGKDFALEKYKAEGLEGKELPEKPLEDFLNENKYDLIFVGTTCADPTERLLIKAARKTGIKSVSIIDQWINYVERFVLDGEVLYPDFVCVMDDFAKAEAIVAGMPENIIKVTGQPYFETIAARRDNLDLNKIHEIRTQLGIKEGEKVFTFASEPISETPKLKEKLGYDQLEILREVINNLPKENTVLIIRPHPRDTKGIFGEFLNERILLEDTLNSQELISITDLVIGMSSMFLIEAALFDKPILSVQIGLKGSDPFVFSRAGKTDTIRTVEELRLRLSQGAGTMADFKIIKKASDNVVTVIKEFINE